MDILEEGQKFERYYVIRQLGRGIAGISYEAEDSRLKSKVVLKLVQPWSEVSYAARRQFFRDMQVLSVLTHPHLVTILNYGEVAGQLYVARRYISNGSLLGNEGRRWFNPPLTIKDAFTYTYQLAQALHLIHSYDYVHGSLIFSNILIPRQPYTEVDYAPLLLSDAGLAQFVRRFGRTQQNMFPMTAAPEQFKGQVTPASDQYALAILLYVWLTGHPPFAGSPAEIEQLKLVGTISIPDRLLTREQEGIIRRALNAKQEGRYSSILAFAEALMTSLLSIQQTTEITRNEQDGKAVKLPNSAFDTTQPFPEQVLLPPMSESTQQPSPKREVEPPEVENHYTEQQPQTTTVDTIPTAHLIVTSPFSREARKIPLLKDEVTLGRAGSSDILLDEDTITSRHHAHIKHEGENYVIYDKRSTYGVTVNEQKLEEGRGQILKEGDHIQIGDYSLLFSLQGTKDTDDTHIEHAVR